MKKTMAFLLSLCLACFFSSTAFAKTISETKSGGTTVISAVVPDDHLITVSYAAGAKVLKDGKTVTSFSSARLSKPKILVCAEKGKVISQVLLNGKDITSQFKGGYYTFDPLYEDKTLTVITEDTPAVSKSKTYTVKGTVKRNGQPAENITLQLDSAEETTVTDKNGKFSFANVYCGRHSLMALEDGKVVGYVEFLLTESEIAAFHITDNGVYSVTANRNEVGVNLTLTLTDNETIKIKGISDIKGGTSPTSPQTGDSRNLSFWIFALASGLFGIAATVLYDEKRRNLTK